MPLPGNNRQCVFPARAIAYLTGVLNGMNGGEAKTVQVSRQFRGIGAIIVDPSAALPAGVTVAANLLPPVAGAYAAGVNPSLQIVATGTGALSGDLLVVQC